MSIVILQWPRFSLQFVSSCQSSPASNSHPLLVETDNSLIWGSFVCFLWFVCFSVCSSQILDWTHNFYHVLTHHLCLGVFVLFLVCMCVCLRADKLLDVVDQLFSHHDDQQLLSQFNQTPTRSTLPHKSHVTHMFQPWCRTKAAGHMSFSCFCFKWIIDLTSHLSLLSPCHYENRQCWILTTNTCCVLDSTTTINHQQLDKDVRLHFALQTACCSFQGIQ